MKTYSPKLRDIDNQWYVIDATNLVLGRLAVIVANRIRGKHKSSYAPHMDCGDNIIVVNADKIKVTGNKLEKNKFFWHTGFPGGIKERTWSEILNGRFPERLLSKAVERMITKGPLRRKQMKRLHIYTTADHPHVAQNPAVLDIAKLNIKNKKD